MILHHAKTGVVRTPRTIKQLDASIIELMHFISSLFNKNFLSQYILPEQILQKYYTMFKNTLKSIYVYATSNHFAYAIVLCYQFFYTCWYE